MISNPILYIAAFLALCISFILILVWYRRKEVQDLHTLELQIFAAENNLGYIGLDFAFTQRLEQLNLLPGQGTNTKNILSGKYDLITAQFFEGSCISIEGNSHRRIRIVGILLGFPTHQFPQFHLKQAFHFDSFRPPENMRKADSHLLPDWGKLNYSLFTSQTTLPQELGKLFSHADGLSSLIVDASNFHMLAASGNHLAFYLEGQLQADLASNRQLEQAAHKLIEIFYPPSLINTGADLPNDIKRIKKLN